ncbi:MAG: GNAT family N-acetyltransferase, partial [Mycobacteriales bacterium]
MRPARPAEYAAIAELTVAAYAAGGHLHPSYEPTLRDVAGRAAGSELLVGVLDGRVVGSVAVVTAGGLLADRAARGREASFRMLAVNPTSRGQGVGEALVRACLDRALEAGCPGVAISTQPSMTAAHRL